jgi:hypothetical protein
MSYEGREKICLILSIVWAMMVVIVCLISDMFGSDESWIFILASMLLMLFSFYILFGHIRMFSPFIFFTKKDMEEYNIERISLILGILMAAFSCTFIFLGVYFVMWIPAFGIGLTVETISLYFCASNKYKAIVQPNTCKT